MASQKQAFALQSQIKANAAEAQDYLASLAEWEKDIRAKDAQLRNSPAAVAAAAAAADAQRAFDDAKARGNALYEKGQFDAAVAAYTECVAARPTHALGYLNRAQAYLRLKRFGDADRDATDALRFDPSNLKALYRRATARMELGSTDASLADINQMFAVDRGNKQAKELAAKLHTLLSTKPKPTPAAAAAAAASSSSASSSSSAAATKPAVAASRPASKGSDSKTRPKTTTTAAAAAAAAAKTKLAIVEVTGDDDGDGGDAKAPAAAAASHSASSDQKRSPAKAATPAAATAAAATPADSKTAAAAGSPASSTVATAAATATPSAATAVVVEHPVPASAYQFETLFHACRDDHRSWIAAVRKIPVDAWAATVESGLEVEQFEALLRAAHTYLLPAADWDGLTRVLDGLTRVDRFDLNAMFLGADDKRQLTALFQALLTHTPAAEGQARLRMLMRKYGVDAS